MSQDNHDEVPFVFVSMGLTVETGESFWKLMEAEGMGSCDNQSLPPDVLEFLRTLGIQYISSLIPGFREILTGGQIIADIGRGKVYRARRHAVEYLYRKMGGPFSGESLNSQLGWWIPGGFRPQNEIRAQLKWEAKRFASGNAMEKVNAASSALIGAICLALVVANLDF